MGEMKIDNVIPLSRDQVRSRRKRDVRARTVSLRRITKREMERERIELETLDRVDPIVDVPRRPRTRGDCENGVRPCPYVSCAHNLYLDTTAIGSIKLNFPDIEPGEMMHSCALDCADRGGMSLEAVGEAMNLTRERVRQIEYPTLVQIRASDEGRRLGEFTDSSEPIHSSRMPYSAYEPSGPLTIVDPDEDDSPIATVAADDPDLVWWLRVVEHAYRSYEERSIDLGFTKRSGFVHPKAEDVA